jgi:TldD protein
MKTVLKEILSTIDADYADIRLEEYERTRILYRGTLLEEFGKNFEKGGCLRVFHNGNWGVMNFNELPSAPGAWTQAALKNTTLVKPRAGKIEQVEPKEATITIKKENDTRTIPLEAKRDLINRYNDILLKNKGITSTTAYYEDTLKQSSFASTDGRMIEEEKVYAGISLNAIARDGTNVQSYSKSFGDTRGFNNLLNKENEIEQVAKIALDLLKAEKVEAGVYTIIIDPQLAGVFAHEAFGHLSEADHIYENERLQALMKIGSRFGATELAIVDDPTLTGERGSYHFDDEGIEARRTYLIKDGILAGHLHNRQTAYKMHEPLTGNGRSINYRFAPIVRMSNTFIKPGNYTLEAMLAGIKKGLYVVGSRGGMTELEAFTFSSQYAYLIENGSLTKTMLRDVVLSGNVFETLKNIDAIGSDLTFFGGVGGCGKSGQAPLPVSLGGPHIRIKNIVIGGR